MKKITAVFGGVLAALVSLAPAASAQAAQTAPTAPTVQAAPNCQHGTSFGTVEASAPVTVIGGTARVGTIQLCRDSGYNYYGFVIFNNTLPVNQWGQAYITRYRDGSWDGVLSCDSAGGNKHVSPGESRCWTAKHSGLSGRYTFQAEGQLWNSHGGYVVASGTTIRTR